MGSGDYVTGHGHSFDSGMRSNVQNVQTYLIDELDGRVGARLDGEGGGGRDENRSDDCDLARRERQRRERQSEAVGAGGVYEPERCESAWLSAVVR